MKTVQKGEDLKRLKEDEAEFLVKNKGYKYVPKSTYKGVKEPAPVVEEKAEPSEAKSSEKKKKK